MGWQLCIIGWGSIHFIIFPKKLNQEYKLKLSSFKHTFRTFHTSYAFWGLLVELTTWAHCQRYKSIQNSRGWRKLLGLHQAWAYPTSEQQCQQRKSPWSWCHLLASVLLPLASYPRVLFLFFFFIKLTFLCYGKLMTQMGVPHNRFWWQTFHSCF